MTHSSCSNRVLSGGDASEIFDRYVNLVPGKEEFKIVNQYFADGFENELRQRLKGIDLSKGKISEESFEVEVSKILIEMLEYQKKYHPEKKEKKLRQPKLIQTNKTYQIVVSPS
eukprot:GHVR01087898.1.p1 GENE.GHVR01087898.1~~GHVR01087898.1.p1  ORF type:complete len:114 (-),score=15.93 GHVR01087898.1:192-533(-)